MWRGKPASPFPPCHVRCRIRMRWVSRKMRERVEEVAKRLGYTAGRAPASDSLLALMVSGIANPYNAALIRGVESQARAAGTSLIVGDIADGPEVELAHIERLSDRGVDGIILASSLLPEVELHSGGTSDRSGAVQPRGNRIPKRSHGCARRQPADH